MGKIAHRGTGLGAGDRLPRKRPGGSTPEAGVTPAVARFRQRNEKKMLKKYVRSRNVYENKQISDTMPGKKVGHLCLRFGHLRLTDNNFAENHCFATTICQINSVSYRFFRA